MPATGAPGLTLPSVGHAGTYSTRREAKGKMNAEKVFWYKFFINDYIRDAAHLSMIEHGAYRLLIDQAYLHGGSLPSSLQTIYRLVSAMSKKERDAVQSVLDQFFQSGPDGYHHKRVTSELNTMIKLASVNRNNGAKGGRPKSKKQEPETNPAGFQNESQQEPGENPAGSENETEHEPETNPAGFQNESQQEPREKGSHKSVVTIYPTYLPNARAREDDPAKFSISPDWQPGSDFPDIAKRAGVVLDEHYPQDLGDFVSYWRGEGAENTQTRWEHLLIRNLKSAKVNRSKRNSAQSPVASKGAEKNARTKPTASAHGNFAAQDYLADIKPDGSF